MYVYLLISHNLLTKYLLSLDNYKDYDSISNFKQTSAGIDQNRFRKILIYPGLF